MTTELEMYEQLLDTPEAQALLNSEPEAPWGSLERPAVGPYPLDAMPELGHRIALEAAKSLQVSPAMAACFLIGTLSAAAVGRVQVDMGGGYEEPVQLYIAVGADPSERKSPCLRLLTQPPHDYEREENERRAPVIRQEAVFREAREIALKKAQQKGDEKEAARLAEVLHELPETKPYELIVTDATPEALGQAMARNGGRMAVISAEGALLSVMAGCYAQGPANLDAVLQGYSGEPVSVSRIGRPPVKIEKAALSVCLAVQTEVLEAFINDQQMRQRGTVARFLLAEPESMIGRRLVVGPPMDEELAAKYHRRVKSILSISMPFALKPDEGAREAWEDWAREIERRSCPGGDLRGLGGGWEGKLAGNTLRLAGLMALIDFSGLAIREHVMRGAIRQIRWFADSMKALCGVNELSQEAEEMLRYLARRGERRVSTASVRAGLKNRKRFSRAQETEKALDELAQLGMVRFYHEERKNVMGRPPKPMVLLHPDILKR
ncbi:MAG: YfjI family protein [Eubacteriales bacterium]|nr:YfjI family protein [Eubacteriales bacterium]